MFTLDSDLRKLKRATDKLHEELSIPVGNVSFSYDEQELIRRVFKSIVKQFKGRNDVLIAKEILQKTGWIDE